MEATSETSTPVQKLSGRYLAAKLFSLFGVVPLGVYVVAHLYNNLRSLQGADSFNRHLEENHGQPLIFPLTVLVIWIPIAFHGLYGLFVAKKGRVNLGRFAYFENLKYVLQRLSGIGLLLFIPAHLFKAKIEPILHNEVADFNHMAEGLSEPLTLTVYALGVLGVAFHLSNGLWQAAIGWGITTSEAGMKRMQKVSVLFFIVIAAMGYAAVYGFIRR